MSAKATISKEVFSPQDERMLGAVQVKRRTKKKIPFLATGGQGEYRTYICLSVSNKKPPQVYVTKVKQFEGSSCFVRRSQWTLDQLRQVNGIDPNKESPEFDLQFDNASDQWVASSGSEKFTFFQVLHHTCQRYLPDPKPEFINCQSRLFSGNSILHSAADSVTSAVQKASQALNERGERLGRAEESTADMMNSAQQFADTAHKVFVFTGEPLLFCTFHVLLGESRSLALVPSFRMENWFLDRPLEMQLPYRSFNPEPI
ncbi:syntaxin-binding protein 6 [Pelodytes ibericus]